MISLFLMIAIPVGIFVMTICMAMKNEDKSTF